MAFERVLADEELWVGEMRGVIVHGCPVLLLRTEEGVCAYEDRCAHLGLPLSDGYFSAGVITCAAHHYQYDARTGEGVNPRRVALRVIPVRLEGGEIAVDVPPKEPKP